MAWGLVAVISFLGLGAVAFWAYGPYWIAPVEDFVQGPGGAVAYVSLYNQLRDQAAQFWIGQDVRLVMNQSEFSGMLSSSLLSGKRPENPIQRVRAGLEDGEIRVEIVLQFQGDQVPQRYHGPVGIRLGLSPAVADDGLIRFEITRAAIGRIPVPVGLIKWAGQVFPLNASGFDSQQASILLPLGDMIANWLGREVVIKHFAADDGKLSLVVAMPQPTQQP